MKNKSALWAIVVIFVVGVVGAAVYFGKSSVQKGTLISLKRKLPDLTVVPVRSDTIPATGANFTVKNIGSAASGPFYVKVIRVPTTFESATNPPVYSYFSAVRGLAPGAETLVDTQEADFGYTNALAIGIDLDNRIAELNETNNYFMWSKEVPTEAPFASRP